MKKILIIMLTFFWGKAVVAQTTSVTDTLSYLKTIENQESLFVGKPFQVLMDSLKIQIKSFCPLPNPNNISKEKATGFYFILPDDASDFGSKYLRIEWTTELDGDQSDAIFDASDECGVWTTDAVNFYKTAVIKNIIAR